MTPPFMYYSVAWVWLEYLTSGLDAAEYAMSKCLDLIREVPTTAGKAADLLPGDGGSFGSGGTLAGERIVLYEQNVYYLSGAQPIISPTANSVSILFALYLYILVFSRKH